MSKDINRIKTIAEKITYIQNIVNDHNNKISAALEDKQVTRPAILMHLVSIAEQFDKLKRNDSPLLSYFPQSDLKGINDIRTFIAHDYEGVNLSIIENAIRYGLSDVSQRCMKSLKIIISSFCMTIITL